MVNARAGRGARNRLGTRRKAVTSLAAGSGTLPVRKAPADTCASVWFLRIAGPYGTCTLPLSGRATPTNALESNRLPNSSISCCFERVPGSYALDGHGCRAFATRIGLLLQAIGAGLMLSKGRGDHPCPLLGGRRGTRTIGCTARRNVRHSLISLPAGRKGTAPLLRQGGARGGPSIPYHPSSTTPSNVVLSALQTRRESSRVTNARQSVTVCAVATGQTRDSRAHLTRLTLAAAPPGMRYPWWEGL